MLVAGKDSPDEFVKNFVAHGYNVAVAGNPDLSSASTSAENITSLRWNKTSPVSARSMILETENFFGGFDTTLLVFDAPALATQFTSCTVEDISRALDNLIAGFQYLAVESFARFAQKKINGRLVFLLKTQPTLVEAVRSSQRNISSKPSGPIVAAAQSAFGAFAENFAALSMDHEFGSVLLTIATPQNELSSRDSALAIWLAEYISSINEKEKNQRQVPLWIKAGAKSTNFLSRFL